MKGPVLIKASFFVDTDLFQHLSQWEKSLMDFYAAHGAEIERLHVMGAEGDLFYTVTKLSAIPTPESKPKPGVDLKSVTSATNPGLKKNPAPFIKKNLSKSQPKRGFSPGRQIGFKVKKISMAKFSPQGT